MGDVGVGWGDDDGLGGGDLAVGSSDDGMADAAGSGEDGEGGWDMEVRACVLPGASASCLIALWDSG